MSLLAIHSVPRSGSTWLGQIFNSHPAVVYKYQPLFSYAFKGQLDPHSTRQQVLDFFQQIAVRADDFLDQTAAVEAGIVPRFDKTGQPSHIVYKEVRYHHILENMLRNVPEVKVIGLVRNPWAVLASWKSAPKEFRPEWDFQAEWRSGISKNQGRPEEFYGFDKWCEVAASFQRLASDYPRQFRLVRYADLLADTLAVVGELFEFVGLEMAEQTRRFLVDSRSLNQSDTYSVFKQRAGDDDWHEALTPEIVEQVTAHLAHTGLECFSK